MEKKRIRIETNEEEPDTKNESIIPRDPKEIELSDNSVMDDQSPNSSYDECSNIEAKESERIARALSIKVVEYFKKPRLTNNEVKKEISQPNSINESGVGLDESLTSDLKIEIKEENNLNATEKSIMDLLKDDHFYQEENTFGHPQSKNKKFFKKRSQLHVNIAAGLNSIKYRLKKNYFGHSQR